MQTNTIILGRRGGAVTAATLAELRDPARSHLWLVEGVTCAQIVIYLRIISVVKYLYAY